jgi:HlyD family secretion protein
MKDLKPLIFLVIFVLTACSGGADASPEPTSTIEHTTQGSITSKSIIRANGVLLPAQQMELSFGSGGYIEAVDIGVGESVHAGQVLVRIESTELDLALKQAVAEFAVAEANYDLVAAGNPAEQKVAISTATFDLIAAQQALDAIYDNAEIAGALALRDVIEAQKAVDDAHRVLTNLTSSANQSSIDAAYATMILAEDNLDDAKDAYKPWQNKPENNTTRAMLLTKVAEAQQAYDKAVRLYNSHIDSASDIDLAKAEADLALAQEQLTAAQNYYEILKDGLNPDEIALAEARVVNAQAQLNLAETGDPSAEQLTLAQAQVDTARTNLEIIQAKMDKMVITAPYDGIVSIVRAKQGEWANPGELMVELLDISRWKIETKNVGELQIGRVEIGHDVQVSVNAFKDKALNGRVVAISPVAIVQQGDTTYTLSIELDPTNLNLLPGMTAQVEIRTDGDL